MAHSKEKKATETLKVLMADLLDKYIKTIILEMLRELKEDVGSEKKKSTSKRRISKQRYGKPRKKPESTITFYSIDQYNNQNLKCTRGIQRQIGLDKNFGGQRLWVNKFKVLKEKTVNQYSYIRSSQLIQVEHLTNYHSFIIKNTQQTRNRRRLLQHNKSQKPHTKNPQSTAYTMMKE